MITESTYLDYKEKSLQGRYVTNKQVTNFLKVTNAEALLVETIGYSVEKKPIQSVTIGTGKYKILVWSQMHGNESTTTKAVLDFLNFIDGEESISKAILMNCTLKIIPILNPDGAEVYTRVNANGIDLNRDAQILSQPESILLREAYDTFQPDFCFNLHDQRTIFNVGKTSKPATVSFLAPSHDAKRSISKTRGISMKLIVAMNNVLQNLIPGQVGRYDDAFNANCVGDTFQMLETPTILFEAGHFVRDYEREVTRKYIFYSLLTAIQCIAEKQIYRYSQKDYFDIPENQKLFFDVLIKNAKIINTTYSESVGIVFKEVLKKGKIHLEPHIEKRGKLSEYFGHHVYDCVQISDLKALKNTPYWNLLNQKK
jgi:hypothetical protein